MQEVMYTKFGKHPREALFFTVSRAGLVLLIRSVPVRNHKYSENE